MYLSRIALDTSRRATMQALAAPSHLHGAAEGALPGPRRRSLWRIDRLGGVTYLMLLSEEKPDLSAMQAQFGFADRPWETRDYDALLARIEPGGVWRFRLTANPTRSKPPARQGERGRVEAIALAHDQKGWLLAHAAEKGFALNEGGFDVTESRWVQFVKGENRRTRVTLLSVTFEGVLTVTDAALFRETLARGMGRGKAYGMGLLTVMRHG